ncbi:hypothetical protein GCM10022378_15450 [Salinicoccus jeotgali]|uniref:IrrE N-terminal-like domain-containing protein n=1 Tax=Salinicoccus jeotgali TaxID=381634 RepID=A0ABP7EXL5_9STAP|nr:hypothetical protein GCM10007358_09890 [Jeotgalicoccus schoeneichii]
MSIDNATETEKIRVTFHELAHYHLHGVDTYSSIHIKEMEAEMIAHVVSSYYSLDYVNQWINHLLEANPEKL